MGEKKTTNQLAQEGLASVRSAAQSVLDSFPKPAPGEVADQNLAHARSTLSGILNSCDAEISFLQSRNAS